MTQAPRFLELGFEGYFMCRLATDPDPTNERRGWSGYTMALAKEDDLDQAIRLQPTKYVEKHLRAPAADLGIEIGVRVNAVAVDGAPLPGAEPLLGSPVDLVGENPPFPGPSFESRNDVTGSDDTLAFVVEPFMLRIGPAGSPLISADDVLDPEHPERKIWQIGDPGVYGRRLPTGYTFNSPDVAVAVGVCTPGEDCSSDVVAERIGQYFATRTCWLQQRIDLLQAGTLPSGDPETEAQQLTSRLYQIQFWGNRVVNKLGLKANWKFDINGPKAVSPEVDGALPDGVGVDTGADWPVWFWFGGWDGDLLTGYLRGGLSLPLRQQSGSGRGPEPGRAARRGNREVEIA